MSVKATVTTMRWGKASFSILKSEFIYFKECERVEHFKKGLAEYIDSLQSQTDQDQMKRHETWYYTGIMPVKLLHEILTF